MERISDTVDRTAQRLLERRQSVLRSLRQYYDVPFHPVRGVGQWLYDHTGRRFLDAYNNVPHVGHCHPHVVEALCRQASTLNTNTRYLFEPILDYAERLVATMPAGIDACMFTCTGSEANDLAWRLATTFTGGNGAITTERAYHGNTTFLDTIDGSSIKADRAPSDWWIRVPAPKVSSFPDSRTAQREAKEYARHFSQAVDALRARGHKPAAFFFDTYFCADGVYLPPTGFMREAIEALRKAGTLIIADEVQAGLGRCGTHAWAVQRLGIEPDIVVLGKPMGNGHPIGAVLARKEIIDTFYGKDRYFNTFAANTVTCAVGVAVLDVMERENLQENARRRGEQLKTALEALAKKQMIIGDVRGQGLLLGVELVVDRSTKAPAGKQARWVINEMCRRGVLIGLTGANRQARNVLKLRPPMVFDDEGLDLLVKTLDETLSSIPTEC